MKTFIISLRHIKSEGDYYNNGNYIQDIRNNIRTLEIIKMYGGYNRFMCVRTRSIDKRSWQYKLIYKYLI